MCFFFFLLLYVVDSLFIAYIRAYIALFVTTYWNLNKCLKKFAYKKLFRVALLTRSVYGLEWSNPKASPISGELRNGRRKARSFSYTADNLVQYIIIM